MLAPFGSLTEDEATEMFVEQIEGLRNGGAEVVWIETMSALERGARRRARGVAVGVPYTVTASFDTAGRTMMGRDAGGVRARVRRSYAAAARRRRQLRRRRPDLVVSVLAMTEANPTRSSSPKPTPACRSGMTDITIFWIA